MTKEGEAVGSFWLSAVNSSGRRERSSARPPGLWLVVASCVVAALSFAWMIGLGLYGEAERSAGGGVTSVDGDQTSPESEPRETSRDESTAPEIVLLRLSVLFGVPVASLAFALLARTRRAAIAARGIATLVLAGLTLLTAFSAGPGFALAALLMGAATALVVTEQPGTGA